MPLVGALILRDRLGMGCHLLVIILHCSSKVVPSAVCCMELNSGAQKPSPRVSGVATLAESRRLNCGDETNKGEASELTAKVWVH